MFPIWLSVIVPIYNPPKVQLEESMNHLLNNSYKDVEILLIDDGSEQWVHDLICEKMQNRVNVYYYWKTNGGVSSARNLGMEKSNGKYICFADSDDILFLDVIMESKNSIPPNSQFVIFDFMRENIKSKEQFRWQLLEHDTNGSVDVLYKIIFENDKVCESFAKLYERKILIKNNVRFDVSMVQAEDSMFVLEYIENINAFNYYHKIVYCYEWDMNTTSKRFVKDPIGRLNDIYKYYKQVGKALENRGINTDGVYCSFLNELSSRTMLIMHYGRFTTEVKEYVRLLFMECCKNCKPNKVKLRIYLFLFKHQYWFGFRVLSAIRYCSTKHY